MRSLLEQLENNESVLLMYLAGELPADDHAEVEQQLAIDGALRQELNELRALQESVNGALAALDQREPLPAANGSATRRASRLISQWNVRRLTEPGPAPAASRRAPWFIYPMATAAAIVLAFVIWWGNTRPEPGSYVVAPASPTQPNLIDGPVAVGDSAPAIAPTSAPTLVQLPPETAAVDPVAPAQDDGNRELAVAEAQFRSSVANNDSDSLLGAQ